MKDNLESNMKFNNTTNVEILNEPLDVDEVIRKKSVMEMDEEPLYVFNVSDIIEKHRNWQRCMPRVMPFYGEFTRPDRMIDDNFRSHCNNGIVDKPDRWGDSE